jgi:hypothetical protein
VTVKDTLKFVLAAVFGLLAASSLAQEVIGVVKSSKGDVVIERAGVQVTPTRGTEVHRGDRLITGSGSHATVAMRRAAPVSIGPDNNVALDRFAAGEIPVVKRPAPAILQGLASFLAVNRQR